MKLSSLLLASVATVNGKKKCPINYNKWVCPVSLTFINKNLKSYFNELVFKITNRIQKATAKLNNYSDCLNNDIFGGGKCLKSPALDEYSVLIPNITKEDCSTTCQVRETTFYGIEDGKNCFCGNHPITSEDGTCDVHCQGNPQETCGGEDSTIVFPIKIHGFCFSTSGGDVLHGNVHQNISDNDFERCQTTCRHN